MGTVFETGFETAETGDGAARAAAMSARERMDVDDVDFAAVFPSPTYDCAAVVDGVRSVVGDAAVVGATAEAEFTERGVHTRFHGGGEGVTVGLLASDEIQVYTGFGREVSADPEAAVAEATADIPESVDGHPHMAGLLLSSAVFANEQLALLAYQQRPIEWAGGGAADTSFENTTVFVDDEMASDAVAMAVFAADRPFGLGVGNRHEPVGEGYEVTSADGLVVNELDGRPAFDVWKEAFADVAEEKYGIHVDELERDPRRLFQAFSEMGFGLKTGDDEYKVRSPPFTAFFEPYASAGDEDRSPLDGADETPDVPDPAGEIPTLGTLPEGALQFAHPVTEGAVLYPMTSGARETIDRGEQSVRHAIDDRSLDAVAGGLAFDCPCGELTLREDYERLVDAIAEPAGAPIAGIQSGTDEICLRRDDMRGVHEAATSVLLFPGGEGT